MARIVTEVEQANLVDLMLQTDNFGNFLYGQREIEKLTGLSRPYIRKMAERVGHQFPRNGVEVVGQTVMCKNCGFLFRRPKSKVDRAKNNFCDEVCKKAYMIGPEHPSYRHGKTFSTFSKWCQSQSEYKRFREAVLERAGYKCEITGSTEQLDIHHILPKAEFNSKAFDPNNGMCISKPVHDRIHELIREGFGYEDAILKVQEEHSNVSR